MTREDFDAYCGALTGTTHVIQWGNASVWKIGGKIFAICSGWGDKDQPGETKGSRISFKCSDLAFELLPEQQGIIPAPYLARAKWVQLIDGHEMSDEDIRLHLDAAYEIIAKKLSKKQRADIGIAL